MIKWINKLLGKVNYKLVDKGVDPQKADWSTQALFKPIIITESAKKCKYINLNSFFETNVTVDTEVEDVASGDWFYTVTTVSAGGGITSYPVHCKDLDISYGYCVVPLVRPRTDFSNFKGSFEDYFKKRAEGEYV